MLPNVGTAMVFAFSFNGSNSRPLFPPSQDNFNIKGEARLAKGMAQVDRLLELNSWN